MLALGEESLDLDWPPWCCWWPLGAKCLCLNIILSLWYRLLEGGGVLLAILLTLSQESAPIRL